MIDIYIYMFKSYHKITTKESTKDNKEISRLYNP